MSRAIIEQPSSQFHDQEVEENESIKKARIRIKKFLDQTIVGRPAVAIGLVLAIVNQETGNKKAANVLIDQYKLDKKFGLKKF